MTSRRRKQVVLIVVVTADGGCDGLLCERVVVPAGACQPSWPSSAGCRVLWWLSTPASDWWLLGFITVIAVDKAMRDMPPLTPECVWACVCGCYLGQSALSQTELASQIAPADIHTRTHTHTLSGYLFVHDTHQWPQRYACQAAAVQSDPFNQLLTAGNCRSSSWRDHPENCFQVP